MTYRMGPILLAGALALASASVADAAPQRERAEPPRPVAGTPPLPPRIGCYRLVEGMWRDTPCTDKAFHRRYYPELKVPALNGLVVKNFVGDQGKWSPRFAWTRLRIAVSMVGTVADSKYGANRWSLQNNANLFKGTNDHIDAVQFTTQSHPLVGDDVCIRNVDADLQDYDTTCVHADRVAGRNLKVGDNAEIVGYATREPGTNKPLLGVAAQLPWAKTPSWGLVVADRYGLGDRWSAVSGTLLGFGDGSRLVFGKALVSHTIDAAACLPTPAMAWPDCHNTRSLKQFVKAAPYDVTVETNNLLGGSLAEDSAFFFAPDYALRSFTTGTAACYASYQANAGKAKPVTC